MAGKGEVQEYTRQDLRKATRFAEGDYRGINPREFYRRLKRRLEEVQTASDFKYETYGDQQRDLQILSEEVGSKTGRVEGRLVASSEWGLLGAGKLEYRPYGPHGALAIVVGLLIGIVLGAAEGMAWGIAGIVIVLGGLYGYFQTEIDGFPVARKDVVRTLMTGEVSERTLEEEDEQRTDIFANMSVIYAGDTFVNVYTGELGPTIDDVDSFQDLPWGLRIELIRQVQMWHNRIVVEEQEVDVKGKFLAHLSAWSNRDVSRQRRTIDRIQEAINESFDVRLEYSNVLLEELGAAVRDDIKEQQEEINAELTELADDMDVYVEREGLEHTA